MTGDSSEDRPPRQRVVWEFTIVDGRVTAIEMLAAPETLEGVELALLDHEAPRRSRQVVTTLQVLGLEQS